MTAHISDWNTGVAVDAVWRDACTTASTGLLAALLRYGMKHGLPNMTMQMVWNQAHAMGLLA